VYGELDDVEVDRDLDGGRTGPLSTHPRLAPGAA